MKKLILASSSPRRRDLLRQVGIDFIIRTADVDESLVTTNDPKERVRQLAIIKGENVAAEKDEVILAADTIVAYKNEIFNKPKNEEEAFTMIHRLSGNTHDVYTGVYIRSNDKIVTFVEHTLVEFWPLKEEEIRRYVRTKEPYDKAGGYGIQSVGALFVKQTIGDYYSVVGLPLSRVARELKQFLSCE